MECCEVLSPLGQGQAIDLNALDARRATGARWSRYSHRSAKVGSS